MTFWHFVSLCPKAENQLTRLRYLARDQHKAERIHFSLQEDKILLKVGKEQSLHQDFPVNARSEVM